MKKWLIKKIIAAISVILFFSIQTASTCTIFSLYPNNEHWIGRTFDWDYGQGLIFTNKRNVLKNGLRLLPTDISASWVSQYGSVTFNQFGREFPTGGMNEKGLVVEALELKSAVFPPADGRPSLNELQFIQFLLDNFSSVKNVSEELRSIRLSPVGSKLHYFVCDIKKCMTIEYLNGLLVTHMGAELPVSSFANNSYEEHMNYARQFVTFGGTKPIIIDSKDSLDRFVRASYTTKYIDQYEDPANAVFSFLSDVGSRNNRWQIIYNQDKRTISFRTTAKINLKRIIEVGAFDYSCKEPVLYFDLDSDYQGHVNALFKPFDPAVNHAIIKKSVHMQNLPAPLTEKLAIFPGETMCL
ncbi:MAG: linear amide C-N hydrolase [Bacteriovorax sp.]|jgi:choloylglycine hydrolase